MPIDFSDQTFRTLAAKAVREPHSRDAARDLAEYVENVGGSPEWVSLLRGPEGTVLFGSHDSGSIAESVDIAEFAQMLLPDLEAAVRELPCVCAVSIQLRRGIPQALIVDGIAGRHPVTIPFGALHDLSAGYDVEKMKSCLKSISELAQRLDQHLLHLVPSLVERFGTELTSEKISTVTRFVERVSEQLGPFGPMAVSRANYLFECAIAPFPKHTIQALERIGDGVISLVERAVAGGSLGLLFTVAAAVESGRKLHSSKAVMDFASDVLTALEARIPPDARDTFGTVNEIWLAGAFADFQGKLTVRSAAAIIGLTSHELGASDEYDYDRLTEVSRFMRGIGPDFMQPEFMPPITRMNQYVTGSFQDFLNDGLKPIVDLLASKVTEASLTHVLGLLEWNDESQTDCDAREVLETYLAYELKQPGASLDTAGVHAATQRVRRDLSARVV